MKKKLKEVKLYTDGACSFNPGPGGFGFVLIYKNVVKQFSGFKESTTNNQMELTAVVEGLKKLKEKCRVTIHTDSAYVLNGFVQGWVENWQNNNWKNANKKEVLNKELWQQLLAQVKMHEVEWVKVKGHSNDHYNNLCDELARKEIEKFMKNNGENKTET